jgi:hypothetical protein
MAIWTEKLTHINTYIHSMGLCHKDGDGTSHISYVMLVTNELHHVSSDRQEQRLNNLKDIKGT